MEQLRFLGQQCVDQECWSVVFGFNLPVLPVSSCPAAHGSKKDYAMNALHLLSLVFRPKLTDLLDKKCDVYVLISGVTGISHKVVAPLYSMSSVI